MKELIVLFALTIILVSCVNEIDNEKPIQISDNIFQYSTKSTLLAHDYKGDITVGEIKENGDFGLGTFNMFDGEMVLYNGNAYQALTNGEINSMPSESLSPYVVAKFFNADTSFSLPNNLSLDSVKTLLNSLVGNSLAPLAIKMTAIFKTLKSRSIDKVSDESISLAEIISNQTEFNFENVNGTVIGFWYPDYFDGVNFTGFHFHVLLDDLSGGGHMLDCTFESVNIEIDYASGVIVAL